MENMDQPTKRKQGRPRLYNSVKEINEAKQTYRKEWYQRNKEKVAEHQSTEQYRENKNKRKLKGFYKIYCPENNQVFIGWSVDATNRVSQTLRKIKNPDENGRILGKFDKSKDWKFKMIELWEDNDFERLDKIKHDMKKDYPDIEFI